jgi:hypothetical protein
MKSPREIGEEVAHEIVRLSGGLCITRATAIIAAAIEARDAEAAAEFDKLRAENERLKEDRDGALIDAKATWKNANQILFRELDRLREENAAMIEVIRGLRTAAAVWKKEEDYHLGRDR